MEQIDKILFLGLMVVLAVLLGMAATHIGDEVGRDNTTNHAGIQFEARP